MKTILKNETTLPLLQFSFGILLGLTMPFLLPKCILYKLNEEDFKQQTPKQEKEKQVRLGTEVGDKNSLLKTQQHILLIDWLPTTQCLVAAKADIQKTVFKYLH